MICEMLLLRYVNKGNKIARYETFNNVCKIREDTETYLNMYSLLVSSSCHRAFLVRVTHIQYNSTPFCYTVGHIHLKVTDLAVITVTSRI